MYSAREKAHHFFISQSIVQTDSAIREFIRLLKLQDFETKQACSETVKNCSTIEEAEDACKSVTTI